MEFAGTTTWFVGEACKEWFHPLNCLDTASVELVNDMSDSQSAVKMAAFWIGTATLGACTSHHRLHPTATEEMFEQSFAACECQMTIQYQVSRGTRSR